MKKYFIQRPQVSYAIKWDGTNLSEFENDPFYGNLFTYSINGNGDLEALEDGIHPLTVPLNSYMYYSSTFTDPTNPELGMQEVPAEGPFDYEVEEI